MKNQSAIFTAALILCSIAAILQFITGNIPLGVIMAVVAAGCAFGLKGKKK